MIIPVNVSVTEWCDMSTPDLLKFGPIPLLLNPDQWQNWARFVITLPQISEVQPPLPESFSRWDQWAFRFIQTLQAANLI